MGQYVILPWAPDGGEIAVSRMGPDKYRGLAAWDNVCPHRGSRVLPDCGGFSNHKCPYHNRLAHAGNVRQYPLNVNCGFVWVRPGEGETVPPPRTDVLSYAFGVGRCWQLHSELRFVMYCDWTVAVENALDCEHIEFVHDGSLGTLDLESDGWDQLPGGSSFESFTSGRSAELTKLGNILGFGTRERDYAHLHLAPFSCFSSTRGYSLSFQQYFPTKDGKTNFIHKLYGDLSIKVAARRAYLDQVAAMNKAVFEEDARVCSGVRAGFAGNLGPFDLRIQHFRSSL